jgi:phosphatidate cytidylyltransferase
MLKQRVITAVILLALLLPALFYPNPIPFNAMTLLLIAAAGWEWARLNGCSHQPALLWGAALGVVLATLWMTVGLGAAGPWLWWLAGGFWLLLTPWLLKQGIGGWPLVPRWLRLSVGWVLIGLAWWAMAQAREQGIGMLLSILLLVWVADVAAYFGGKALGKRKLAINISPGKSWEGAISGALGVLLLAVLWNAWWPNPASPTLFTHVFAWGWPLALLAVFVLTAMSVTGDLVESLVKRSAGMKDSSQLLPGHGGVLDRVDALLPVLPVAMMLMGWSA